MVGGATLKRNSYISKLACGRPHRRQGFTWLAMLCVSLILSEIAFAQSSESQSLEAYATAMRQSVVTDRIQAMERYLSLAGHGRLEMDALEVLIWDYIRVGNSAQSARHARELLKLEPGNAIAVAALSQGSVQTKGSHAAKARVERAKAALVQLENLRRPEGMMDVNFQLLRRQTEGILDGEAGLGYLAQEHYQLARTYLTQAVAADSNNSQYVYGLALALLYGDHRDPENGYWYLARAVNLTRGSPGGLQIADYARKKYRGEGGRSADWDGFLAATVGTAPSPSPAGAVAGASLKSSAKPAEAPKTSPEVAKNRGNAASAKGTKTLSQEEIREALLREPESVSRSSSVTRPEKDRAVSPNPPVSLGILIETALLTHENRGVILSTIRELISNLRRGDEVAILVFSDQLDFEQDLTSSDELLEEAMAQLKPKPGRALLDGVVFAAGHLKRIGKNANRVLVVISDGRSSKVKQESMPLSAQISGVKIDCIGLKAEGASERDLLQRLASYSGGQAAFASGPRQFRQAALQVAQNAGILIQ